ncbi:MAG: hypothetical protein KDD55_11450 [Bdellovibrionales bacterium]|nr:hypothetical protein [Bdellovibrionales bacterium]
MTISELFTTQVYSASLGRVAGDLNNDILDEVERLYEIDEVGRQWSEDNYLGGYTSYSSFCELHRMSSTFSRLEEKIRKHVLLFAEELEYDLGSGTLEMSDCWVNVMQAGTVHTSHIHPLSCISGTYYVQVPEGASGIVFEDPRLGFLMAAPPRKKRCKKKNRSHVRIQPASGKVVLFESWLRHEVPPSPCEDERVGVSFNYIWK